MNIQEIKSRISQSNLSAANQRGQKPKYPIGMATLITELHQFQEIDDHPSGIDGIWSPKNQDGFVFDHKYVDLYRGAFARMSMGNPLKEGPRGRTAIYNIFCNEQVRKSINRLFFLSHDKPSHLLTIDWMNNDILEKCGIFWNLCSENNISVIYRSKTLSMIFPDLFVPFDTRSMKKLRQDVRDKKLKGVEKLPANNDFSWDKYVEIHLGFKNFCSTILDDEGLQSVTELRNLSLYHDNGENVQKMFDDIAAMNITSPPPITRFIDKIFYMPSQS